MSKRTFDKKIYFDCTFIQSSHKYTYDLSLDCTDGLRGGIKVKTSLRGSKPQIENFKKAKVSFKEKFKQNDDEFNDLRVQNEKSSDADLDLRTRSLSTILSKLKERRRKKYNLPIKEDDSSDD